MRAWLLAIFVVLTGCGRLRFQQLLVSDDTRDGSVDASLDVRSGGDARRDAADPDAPDAPPVDASIDARDDVDIPDAEEDASDADAATPTEVTTRAYIAPGGFWVTGVGVDGTGNAYITGRTFGAVDLGDGVFGDVGSCSYVASYDRAGTLRYTRPLCADVLLDLRDIQVSTDATVRVFGFGSGTPAFTTPPLGAGQTLLAVALDAAGTITNTWVRDSVGGGNSQGYAIAHDGASRFAVGGLYAGDTDFGDGVILPASATDQGFVVVSTATSTLWGHEIPDTIGGFVTDVAFTSDGSVCVAGRHAGLVDFGLGPMGVAGEGGGYGARYDADGNFSQAYVMSNPGSDTMMWGAAGLPDGRCLFTGRSGPSTTADFTPVTEGAVVVWMNDTTIAPMVLPGTGYATRPTVANDGRIFVGLMIDGVLMLGAAGMLTAVGATDSGVVELDLISLAPLRAWQNAGTGSSTVWQVVHEPVTNDLVFGGQCAGEFEDAAGTESDCGASGGYFTRVDL